MALRAGAAYVDILPRLGHGFSGNLEQQLVSGGKGGAAAGGRRLGGIFSSTLGKAALVGGAVVAAKKAKDFLGGAIAAARESNKVGRQTDAVLKSTAGAANVSASAVGKLAERIAMKTGIDDEAIQSAENLLLTFTDVRNEVGRGNDVFNQATRIATDMGAALKNGPAANSILVGKALNDPVKGITALTRVGVSFTDQQKDQIRALAESGDKLGAQKIILGELRKEFGGSAAAQATAADRLKVTLGNLQEQLGNKLVPLIDRSAKWLADRLPGALDKAGRFFRQLGEDLKPAVDAVKSFLYTLTSGFSEDDALTGPEKLAFFVRDKVLPVLKNVAEFVSRNLKPILVGLGVTFLALTSPVTLIVGALVAAYLKFEGFRKVVDVVARFLVTKAGPAIADFLSMVVDKVGEVVAYVRRVWPQISEAIGHVLTVVEGYVRAWVAVISFVWETFGDHILQLVGAVWDQIRLVVKTAIDVLRGIFEVGLALINGDWGKAWDALKGIVGSVWELIKGTVSNALEYLKGVIGAALDLISAAWSGVWSALGDVFTGIWDGIKRTAGNAANYLIEHVLNPLIAGLDSVLDLLDKLTPGDTFPSLDPLGLVYVPPEGPRPIAGDDIRARATATSGLAPEDMSWLDLYPAAAESGKTRGGIVVEHMEVRPVQMNPSAPEIADAIDRKLGWRTAVEAGRRP